ncbi:MAG: right-handed parallel beta-helix repeat-containing protein [Pseudomonadales bacterium]
MANLFLKGKLEMKIRDLMVSLYIYSFSMSAYAADYFISSTQGNDVNDGATAASAFYSLAKINSLNLLPGDRVLFKSGDQWKGMFWPKGSGTQALPIHIGSYGGEAPAIIDGDGFQASILIFNDDYYEISNLELTNEASYLDAINGQAKKLSGFGGQENSWGSGRDVRFGIKIVASTRSLNYFRLNNINIHDIYPTPNTLTLKHQGYGVKFESQSNVATNNINTISNVVIDSVTIEKTGHYGIWIKPLGLNGIDLYKHYDFTLRNSSFLNTGGSGFVSVKAANVLVENNLFDGTGSSDDSRMWQRGSGTWPFDSKNVVIQNNVFKNAKGPLDSYGVHIDYNNENVVVQYNFSYNNEGGFVQILGANINSGYRYNISVADGSRVKDINGALQNGRIFHVSDYCNVNAGCPSTSNFIYNNTVFVPSAISPEIYFHANSGETLFYNNLIYLEQGSTPLTTVLSDQGVQLSVSNNLYYPLASFSLDQKLTTNAIYNNPGLRLAGSQLPSMYKLVSGSPAKHAGKIIQGSEDVSVYSFNNGGRDYFGNTVSDSIAPHIGAYNANELLSGFISEDEFNIPMITSTLTSLLAGVLLVISMRRKSPH